MRRSANLSMHEIARLKPVGFWRSEREPDLPHPRNLVDVSWSSEERASVLLYLGDAYVGPYHSCGMSWSRLGCPGHPDDIGTLDLTDGTFLFPEGFAHSIRVHAVRPPDVFSHHLRSHEFKVPDLPCYLE